MTQDEAAIGRDSRIRRNPKVTYRDLEDGGVLLHLESGAYHGLNSTGSAIWKLLDDDPTLEELSHRLRAALDDPPPTLDEDVLRFVQSMSARDLLSAGEA
jgi:hypothetical protein